ncbi:hypothetical protein HOY82DRAFT_569136 [Tuber indicum]|nr:hypothetical protein HOY82DRAFT_569136 [Tuber indicum]
MGIAIIAVTLSILISGGKYKAAMRLVWVSDFHNAHHHPCFSHCKFSALYEHARVGYSTDIVPYQYSTAPKRDIPSDKVGVRFCPVPSNQ